MCYSQVYSIKTQIKNNKLISSSENQQLFIFKASQTTVLLKEAANLLVRLWLVF